MSESKKLIPKRRFKEFVNSKEWLQSFLHEISEIYDGTHQTPKYTKSGIMFLSVEDIKTLHSQKFISEQAYEKDFKIKPAKNDILMTRIGDIGTANIIEYDISIAYYVSLALIRTNLNAYFLQANITSPYIQAELWKRTLHVAFPKKINKNEIENILVNYPSLKEQTQIGEFFKKLDNLINTQQKKLEKAKTLKSAYLREMFPNEGELKPRLRFTGFNISWKEKKLEEITKTTIGEFVIKTKQNPNSPYPVYNGGISYTGFYDEFNNEANKIVISARGANAGFINIVRNRYWAGNSCYSINIINNTLLSIDYLFYSLKRNQHFFTQNQQAANIPSVSKKEVETFTVLLTNITEQTKIGNFFKLLDDKIALVQKKLDKLKNIKQAYLNEMFV
jgi:type I restriction enzyme, S subunit